MARYVIGVTLTPEERTLMRLPPLGSSFQPRTRVCSHEMTALLPDGATCPVSYRRFSSTSHRFVFAEPLHETIWLSEGLTNQVPSIEAKALELAPKAFAQAMAAEQQMMRCRTKPKRSTLPLGEPQLKVETATLLAGTYAVCLRFSNGRLSPVGTASTRADPAVVAFADGSFDHVQLFGQQRLVIGICCRYLRRWVEPRFLPCPHTAISVPEPEKLTLTPVLFLSISRPPPEFIRAAFVCFRLPTARRHILAVLLRTRR